MAKLAGTSRRPHVYFERAGEGDIHLFLKTYLEQYSATKDVMNAGEVMEGAGVEAEEEIDVEAGGDRLLGIGPFREEDGLGVVFIEPGPEALPEAS